MPTFVVYFRGGPCDGTTRTITYRTGHFPKTLVCQQEVYVALQVETIKGRDDYVFITEAAAKAAAGGTGKPAHVSQAWTRWMRALGHTGPKAHNRIQKATVRARRIAR